MSGEIVITPPYRILPACADRDGGVASFRAVVGFDGREWFLGPHGTEEGCWEAVRRFVKGRFGLQLADLAEYRRLPIAVSCLPACAGRHRQACLPG